MAVEAAKKLQTSTKGQITQCTNQLKMIHTMAQIEDVRPLIEDLETQNLYQKLQSLSSSFEAVHEKYISVRDTKETEAEEVAQVAVDLAYYEDMLNKVYEMTRIYNDKRIPILKQDMEDAMKLLMAQEETQM